MVVDTFAHGSLTTITINIIVWYYANYFELILYTIHNDRLWTVDFDCSSIQNFEYTEIVPRVEHSLFIYYAWSIRLFHLINSQWPNGRD